MGRREFIAILFGAALVWPSSALPQAEEETLGEIPPTQDLFAIVQGGRWNTRNLTFSFPTQVVFYGDPDEYHEALEALANGVVRRPLDNFSPFTPELREATRKALALYASFGNLTFTEITESINQHADLRFGMGTTSDGRSFGVGPHPGLDPIITGDVWLSSDQSWFPVPGNKDFWGVMHEIGHVLGLRHDSGVEPGESEAPTGTRLEADHDGWDYTIMSYNSYPDGGESFGFTPQTPMIADVAAIQYLYEPNFAHNSDDTIYRWDPITGEMFVNGVDQGTPNNNFIYMTLWDGGGTDTLDFSNYPRDARINVVVDLRPEEWSTPTELQLVPLSGAGEPPVNARGCIANPLLYGGDDRSLIENAKGGSGDDTFIGNQADNVFTGKDGDDTFFYTRGNDTFDGGFKDTAGDTANFSLSPRSVRIAPVVSTITLNLPTGEIRVVEIDDGTPLADSAGNSFVASGPAGAPVRKVMASLHGIENLTGSRFDDVLTGNGDANIIDGGAGDDILTGGAGADTFVLKPGSTLKKGSGDDVITDFGNGDRIDLRAFRTSFLALDDDRDRRFEPGEGGDGITAQLVGRDLLLSFAGGSVRIEGIKELLISNFVF